MKNPRITLKGPLSSFTGYGKLFQAYVQGFLKLKIPFELQAAYNHIPEYSDAALVALLGDVEPQPDYGLFFGYGNQLPQVGNPHKLLYSMYETTDIPHDWKDFVRRADGVIVPSYFCQQVFQMYNSRVEICLPGVNTDIYKPNPSRKPNDVFAIGTCGVMSQRKGIDILIRGFQAAFPQDKDVRLVVKTRDTKWMVRVDDSRIIYIEEDWPESKLVEFYQALDLFVLVSRGEGIGLPPLEASLCGTPGLVTRWSGLTEIIDDKNIYGIDITDIVRVPDGMMASKEAYWAEPSLTDLVDKMRCMYHNPKRIRMNSSKWSQVFAAQRLKGVLEKWTKLQ